MQVLPESVCYTFSIHLQSLVCVTQTDTLTHIHSLSRKRAQLAHRQFQSLLRLLFVLANSTRAPLSPFGQLLEHSAEGEREIDRERGSIVRA